MICLKLRGLYTGLVVHIQNGRVECEYKHLLKVTSSSYTPQHNGRVEREHKHLLKVVSSLKLQSVIHAYFCRPCVLFI